MTAGIHDGMNFLLLAGNQQLLEEINLEQRLTTCKCDTTPRLVIERQVTLISMISRSTEIDRPTSSRPE
jgi:hypothetical protein